MLCFKTLEEGRKRNREMLLSTPFNSHFPQKPFFILVNFISVISNKLDGQMLQIIVKCVHEEIVLKGAWSGQ